MSDDEELSEKEIRNHLGDRHWRLNHLYIITDEHGQRTIFTFNWFQSLLFKTLHFLSIVLKARQVGITTFFCILYLDDVLFGDNIKAAVIADTREHATKIFQEKIKFPYDNLPEFIREELKADTDSSQMLRFTNNSSIEVATSVRSGTYQRLHITEFAKISAKTPEKAKEIVTGSLNTVHSGEFISIESTAEGAFGYFFDFFKQAEALRLSNTPLTELDYKSFFFAWWQVPHYRLRGHFLLPETLRKYFDELQIKLNIIIDEEQRNWYWKKSLQQGDEMHREYPSFPDEAFQAAMEGSIFGKLVDLSRSSGRIRFVPHDPNLQVDTWWDLGFNDFNVVLFTQQFASEIRIIDVIITQNESLQHVVSLLGKYRDEKEYHYHTHNFPADIKVHELTTGKTRWESLIKMGMSEQTMRLVPILSLQDSIEAVKRIFNRFFIDERLDEVIKALSLYRREWDDKLGVFKSTPLHDDSSHVCSAFRLLGVGLIDEIAAIVPGRYNYIGQQDEMTDYERQRIV